MKITYFTIFFILIICGFLYSSWECEQEDKKVKEKYTDDTLNDFITNETSVLKLHFFILIRIYHITLSGKTGSKCIFYPSCSRFSYYAIKQYGAIKGTLMGIDRVWRCNPLSYDDNYILDYKKRLLFDPVENNSVFNFPFDYLNF